MSTLLERLLSRGPVLLDGAWGTQLQARGLRPGECPDIWNLTHPEEVSALATAYVAAGSRIILTNTFGSNRIVLERHGLEARAGEINRAGVELSKRAAAGRAHVFASIGPSGKMLVSGEVTQEQLETAFREQAKALADAGAEGFVIETMTELAEAAIAISSVREFGLPVVACMAFDTGPQKDRTMMGLTPEQAAAGLEAAGADVVGANCGQGIERYFALCERLRSATTRPLWLKPNAGTPELVNGQPVYRTTAEHFAAFVPPLLSAGATFIGSCCGSSPLFIQSIRTSLSLASGPAFNRKP